MEAQASAEAAKIRSTIIHGLQSSALSKRTAVPEPQTADAACYKRLRDDKRINGLSALQSFVDEPSERFKAAVAEQISQRTIVLENTKQQTDAAKSKKKLANAIARQRKASNKMMKRSAFCDVSQKNSLSPDCVRALHDSWRQYATSVMQDCSSQQQAQARLLAMQLVGAKMRVVHSSNSSVIGLEGVVVKDTANTVTLYTHDGALRMITKSVVRMAVEFDEHVGIWHGAALLPVKTRGKPRVN